MKIKNLFSNNQHLLVIGWHSYSLSLALLSKGKPERFEKILLRETPEQVIASRISAFLQGQKPAQTVLVLSRSEVLQKELVFQDVQTVSLRERLQTKLQEMLPCPPSEMSYGFFLNEDHESAEGVLFALPEKRITEILGFLSRIGLKPDEIITEDQSLAWAACIENAREGCLVIDKDPERILCVYVNKGRLEFSRVLSPDTFTADPFQSMFEEISFLLLETDSKPRQILLAGDWEAGGESEIARRFSLPGKVLPGNGVPASLWGAADYKKQTPISLLPHKLKILKKRNERQKINHQIGLGLLALILAISLLFAVQWLRQKIEVQKIQSEIQVMSSQIRPLEKIHSSLVRLRDSQYSQEKILTLLEKLNDQMPSGIGLVEMRIEGADFHFKAESASHSAISDSVQILEKTGMIEKAVLQHTRLRKRLNQDIFEFEVKGKWKT